MIKGIWFILLRFLVCLARGLTLLRQALRPLRPLLSLRRLRYFPALPVVRSRRIRRGMWSLARATLPLLLLGLGTLAQSAEILPSSIPNMLYWFQPDQGTVYVDAGSTLATNSQTCQQMNDSGPYAYNASQATGGNRPTYLTNTVNGKAVLSFDGTTSYMTFAATSGTDALNTTNAQYQPRTQFFVFQINTGAGTFSTLWDKGNQSASGTYTNDADEWFLVNTGGFWRYGQSVKTNSPYNAYAALGTINLNTPYVVCYQWTPYAMAPGAAVPYIEGRERLYVNGVLVVERDNVIPPADTTHAWTLGATSDTQSFAKMYLCSFIGYNRVLSEDERAQVEAYEGKEFGIPLVNIGRAFPSIESTAPNFIWDTNSLGYGWNGSGSNLISMVQALYRGPATFTGGGIPGVTTSQMTTNAAGKADTLVRIGTQNFCIVWETTNGVSISGNSAATEYTNLQAYCNARRATGLYDGIIVVSLLPRGAGTAGGWTEVGTEATRATFNGLLRADFPAVVNGLGKAGGGVTYADWLIDLGYGTNLTDTVTIGSTTVALGQLGAPYAYSSGTQGGALNATYWGSDKIHWTAAGCNLAAQWINACLPTILSSFPGGGARIDSRSLAAAGYTATRAANLDNANVSSAAIKTQTDKLLFDGSNNIKSTPQTLTGVVGTGVGQISLSSGGVLVGSYAAGMSPDTLVWSYLVDGTINARDYLAVLGSTNLESDRTWNPGTHTAVLTYYRRTGAGVGVDKTKPMITKTTVYDVTNTQVVSATVTLTNLP